MKYRKISMDDLAKAIDEKYNYLWFCRMARTYYATINKGEPSYSEIAVCVCGEHILDVDYTWSSRSEPVELKEYRKA